MPLPELPNWSAPVLQGLSFWIGYRYAKYPHHRLVEGAIVGEMCNLLNGEISSQERLHCEVAYKSIIGTPANGRADLVITSGKARSQAAHNFDTDTQSVIEVKRGQAVDQRIESDLHRLLRVKQANPAVRTFLILVSQRSRPDQFVTKNGTARRNHFSTPNDKGEYRVRLVKKATRSFKETSMENAHYSCMIEVFRAT